jgi:NAD(P)-dependent dehydrogenase (short-subunit alcohol dehydrogenase family)
MSDKQNASRRIVITGACGAYGRELAARFSACGHPLVLVDIMQEYGFAHELTGQGDFSYHACDFKDADAVTALAQHIVRDGAPWALINNAGTFPFDELADMAPDAISSVLAVNFTAPVILSQHLGAAMAEAGGGCICNVSSGAADVVRSNGAIYGASKAALEQITRAFAVTLGPAGVRVNAVRPGLRTRNLVSPLAAGHQDRIKASIPLRRLSEDGELANLLAFLCSDEGRFITGQVIGVDGGNAINRRIQTTEAM